MNIFQRIKRWFTKLAEERQKEADEWMIAHTIPLEVGHTISSRNGVIYKDGKPYTGRGYENGREVEIKGGSK